MHWQGLKSAKKRGGIYIERKNMEDCWPTCSRILSMIFLSILNPYTEKEHGKNPRTCWSAIFHQPQKKIKKSARHSKNANSDLQNKLTSIFQVTPSMLTFNTLKTTKTQNLVSKSQPQSMKCLLVAEYLFARDYTRCRRKVSRVCSECEEGCILTLWPPVNPKIIPAQDESGRKMVKGEMRGPKRK